MFGGISAHTPGGLDEYYLLGWRMTINCALYYFRQAEERKGYYLAEIHILGRKIYLVGMKMICWYVHTMYYLRKVSFWRSAVLIRSTNTV